MILSRKRKRNKRRGLGVLEFILVFNISALLLGTVLKLCFMFWVKSQAQHGLYTALLCRAKGYTEGECKRKVFQMDLFQNYKSIELEKTGNKYRGKIIVEGFLWKIELRRTLRIPEDLL